MAGKSATKGLDLLHIYQLILHSTAVSAKISLTPSHHGSIAKNGSKRITSGSDLLRILQLMQNSAAVTAIIIITPGHDRTIAKNGS